MQQEVQREVENYQHLAAHEETSINLVADPMEDLIDPEAIPCPPPQDVASSTFLGAVQEEFERPFEDRLHHNFLDGIIGVAEAAVSDIYMWCPVCVRNLAPNRSIPVTRELFKREILRQFGAANRWAFYLVESESATRRNAGTASHSEIPLERWQYPPKNSFAPTGCCWGRCNEADSGLFLDQRNPQRP
jgi:hypothetical protein